MEPNLYDLFYDEHVETIITWRNLPHWKQSGKLYFITWRQADSLPQNHIIQLRSDRAAWDRQHANTPVHSLQGSARTEYYRLFHHRVQAWLDAGHGSCLLRRPDARRIMIDALYCFNGQRYRLGSFALAWNHVHLLVVPLPGVDLSKVLHSWKSFTANAINKAVGRSGTLWRDESYDRLVRDPAHLTRVEEYIAAHVRQGAYFERIPVAGMEG